MKQQPEWLMRLNATFDRIEKKRYDPEDPKCGAMRAHFLSDFDKKYICDSEVRADPKQFLDEQWRLWDSMHATNQPENHISDDPISQ